MNEEIRQAKMTFIRPLVVWMVVLAFVTPLDTWVGWVLFTRPEPALVFWFMKVGAIILAIGVIAETLVSWRAMRREIADIRRRYGASP